MISLLTDSIIVHEVKYESNPNYWNKVMTLLILVMILINCYWQSIVIQMAWWNDNQWRWWNPVHSNERPSNVSITMVMWHPKWNIDDINDNVMILTDINIQWYWWYENNERH